MASNGYKRISTDEADHKEKVTIFSLLFFLRMSNIFKTGSKRALEETDFLPLSNENTTFSVTKKLQKKWNDEITKCKGNDERPKLWKSVVKMLSAKDAIIMVFSFALYSIGRLIQPLLLAYLISTLISDEPQENYLLYGCALAMGISPLIGCLGLHQYGHEAELLDIRIISALKGLVYIKVSG